MASSSLFKLHASSKSAPEPRPAIDQAWLRSRTSCLRSQQGGAPPRLEARCCRGWRRGAPPRLEARSTKLGFDPTAAVPLSPLAQWWTELLSSVVLCHLWLEQLLGMGALVEQWWVLVQQQHAQQQQWGLLEQQQQHWWVLEKQQQQQHEQQWGAGARFGPLLRSQK